MRIKVLFILLTLLSACTSNGRLNNDQRSPQHAQIHFVSLTDSRTEELLNFIANYADSMPDEQNALFLENTQALAKDKTDTELRIQHSAMLALPTSIVKDIPRAKSLLESLLASNELNVSETSLAKLLLTYTHESDMQINKINDLSKKNETIKQKNKVLTQKLNDLKNIEKTMIERNGQTNNNKQ